MNKSQHLLPDMQAHLLCYVVLSALTSHALTNNWKVEHSVESIRIWLTRNRQSASWLQRVRLGQFGFKLARDQIAAKRRIAHRDIALLFTHEMMPNYRNLHVQQIWQLCSNALNERDGLQDVSARTGDPDSDLHSA
jgi:hypothetical protein